MKRQHNFLNNQLGFNEKLYLNNLSFYKFLSFNYDLKISYINKNIFKNFDIKHLTHTPILSHYFFLSTPAFHSTVGTNFFKIAAFKHFKYLFNNDSDKKKLTKPFTKSLVNYRLNFFNNKNFIVASTTPFYNNFSNADFFQNSSIINKTFDNFSSNQSILTSSKFIRKHLNVLPTKSSFNLNTLFNN
jgi:hypothetical protein